MSDQPGCPCSICEDSYTMSDIVPGGMSDNTPLPDIALRDRIAAAIYDHPNSLSREQCREVADAVIRDVLTPEFLADLVITAVQKAADDE